jgi:hypothetical protein
LVTAGAVTGEHDIQAGDGFVRVLLWQDELDSGLATLDESLLQVAVSNVNERPAPSSLEVHVPENVKKGYVVGSMSVEDDQGQEALTFEITNGNLFDAIAYNNGIITVNNASVFNYEFLSFQDHQIRLK